MKKALAFLMAAVMLMSMLTACGNKDNAGNKDNNDVNTEETDKAAAGSYQFVRTTVLTKTTLSDTVSVTGTVAVVEPAAKALTLSESVRSIASSNAGILFRFIKAPFCGGRYLPPAACTCRNYATVSHSITNTTFATVAFFIVLESGVTMAA